MTPEQVAARLAARARDLLAWQRRWVEANPSEARAARRAACVSGRVASCDDPVVSVRASELLAVCEPVSVPVEVDGQASIFDLEVTG